jgi:ketosteroid isomerase-like protein
MRAVMLLCFSGFVLPASALAADASGADADRAAIEALQKTYNEGFNAKDVDKIMSCYAPGKRLFVFDVAPPRAYASWESFKKDWEEVFAAFPGPLTNVVSDMTVNVVGTVAWGHTIETGEFTGKDGKKVKMVVRTTDIYRKIKGKWLIVEEHNSIPVDLVTFKPDLLSKP